MWSFTSDPFKSSYSELCLYSYIKLSSVSKNDSVSW